MCFLSNIGNDGTVSNEYDSAFLTDVITRRRVLLTSSISSVKLLSEVGLQQALFRSMSSCRIAFNQFVTNSDNHLGRTWPTEIFWAT